MVKKRQALLLTLIFSLTSLWAQQTAPQEEAPDPETAWVTKANSTRADPGVADRRAAEANQKALDAAKAADSSRAADEPAAAKIVEPDMEYISGKAEADAAKANTAEADAAKAARQNDEDAPALDMEEVLRQCITDTAQLYLGVPYKAAGVTPEGFDCSGFVYYVYMEAAGMELSRSTVGLWNGGKPIKIADVKPGDLLIFTTVRPGASHVGIVIENSPETGITFIHAASQGSKVGVIISNLKENYYKKRVMGARRFF